MSVNKHALAGLLAVGMLTALGDSISITAAGVGVDPAQRPWGAPAPRQHKHKQRKARKKAAKKMRQASRAKNK